MHERVCGQQQRQRVSGVVCIVVWLLLLPGVPCIAFSERSILTQKSCNRGALSSRCKRRLGGTRVCFSSWQWPAREKAGRERQSTTNEQTGRPVPQCGCGSMLHCCTAALQCNSSRTWSLPISTIDTFRCRCAHCKRVPSKIVVCLANCDCACVCVLTLTTTTIYSLFLLLPWRLRAGD